MAREGVTAPTKPVRLIIFCKKGGEPPFLQNIGTRPYRIATVHFAVEIQYCKSLVLGLLAEFD
jgi:hypothetical protein